jgi:hypothetical protein
MCGAPPIYACAADENKKAVEKGGGVWYTF